MPVARDLKSIANGLAFLEPLLQGRFTQGLYSFQGDYQRCSLRSSPSGRYPYAKTSF